MQTEINIPVILKSVRRVGKLFLKEFKQHKIPETMDDLLKQITAIEETCFDILKSGLKNAFPDTPWVDDDEFDTEAQRRPAPLPEYWLCDTMDGAIQYVQHLPGWTINLVLIQNGQSRFSVIYDPSSDELFWAEDGQGAYLNGNKITTSRKTEKNMMLAVFEYGHQNKADNNLNKKIGLSITDLLDHFGIVRNYGPHGLQLAYVGTGRIDVFVQEDLDTHNWLAGILIAKEAGADILTTDGRPWKWGEDSLMVSTKGAVNEFLASKKNKQIAL